MAGVAAAFMRLSSDNIVQYLLADVPIFCVGIMSLGIFTFFLFMKRADALILCLHLSIIVAFISAILDLVQLLVRGSEAVDDALDLTSVTGLITVREVGYALSFGLRFLFFWGFVAQPPPGEARSMGNVRHNGSWNRWGAIGIVLEISTLALVLVDPVLQVIYRVVTSLHKIGPLYEVESAIQAVLSAVFILKLLLNSWVRWTVNGDVPPTLKTIGNYSAMILALLISALIGIGNLAMFEFTETVLGRFLQAVELYIVMVYVLTSAFYHLRRQSWHRGARSPHGSRDVKTRSPSPQITAPVITSPDLLQVVGRDVQLGSRRPSFMLRTSAASRVSEWLNIRRISDRLSGHVTPPEEMEKASLWKQDEAERGIPPEARDEPGKVPDSAVDVYTPTVSVAQPAHGAPWRDPLETTILPILAVAEKSPTSAGSRQYPGHPPLTSKVSNSSLMRAAAERHQQQQQQSAQSPAASEKVEEGVLLKQRRAPELPRLTIPEPVHSRHPTIDTQRPASEASRYSSVYAPPLTGITEVISGFELPAKTTQPPAAGHVDSGSARSSCISELIRQQAELDKSIAALRLFSPTDETPNTRRLAVVGQGQDGSEARITRSTQSDLSLSNFPEPPWGRASGTSEIAVLTPEVPAGTTKMGEAEAAAVASLPERRISGAMLMVPDANPLRDKERSSRLDMEAAILSSRNRVDSGGTQYEITSFIGRLTHPDQYEQGSFASSILNRSHDGPLVPPQFPGFRGRTDSLESARSIHSLVQAVTSDIVTGPPSDRIPINGSPSPPVAARGYVARDQRFSKRVGLPPRPRITAQDTVVPTSEDPGFS
ncbi:uncharacterized protein LAESUDRAFT_759008 [Laetiporus sulphureus 93-53]|uniref:Uncharacterized protein n=1 Tax=Laetiporus sulphureus 93-53 TaxID=1314785 RepID=A0A165EDY5_9APHY|nr:uncharacterized protein LAESUDRAFT_759008 [Laetiporus sulphureus 93-53]KZT06831.1 hypothetical protein LAESUDRAFT_759008 [Laetiporus sulphureus 93-53]